MNDYNPILKEKMDGVTYLEKLRERYSLYYDINPPRLLKSISKMELIASYHLKMTKSSILSRSLEMYSIEDYEHCFVRLADKKISVEDLESFTTEVRLSGEKIIKPNEHHKKTVLTCVMIAEKGIDDDSMNYVRNFKLKQPYLFYLYGWSEIRIVLVDLASSTIFHNCKNRIYKKRIESFYKIQ